MKTIEKLNSLSNQELQNIRGGRISSPELTLYGSDTNTHKECTCTGSGDNKNEAAKCHCSDASGCSVVTIKEGPTPNL